MTTDGPLSQPLDPREPIPQIETNPARRKRVGRILLRALVSIYCLLIAGLWGWMVIDGDRGWRAT
jgi:hypothetical protein